jgi:two-component system LytT family sensor kinase
VPSEVLDRAFWETLADRVLGYAFMLAATIGLEYHHRASENVRRAAELEARLAQAQLQALKMQLQPHFLFNALNSISALLHSDPAAADRMIARLGDFLRLTLHNEAQMEVPLEDEVRYVSCYLAIQEVRFRDRLTTQITVASDVSRALVPNLILQPLVENAIRHGIEPRAGAGRITIGALRVNGRVRLEVADNGRGPSAPSSPTRGLGLANTAARLRTLYGEEQRFEAGAAPGEGFRVILEMPYRTTEPPACAS